jgi:hypothetical protein
MSTLHYFILTIIMYSGVWSFVEREHWSVQQFIAVVELFMKTVSYSYTAWLPSAVSKT